MSYIAGRDLKVDDKIIAAGQPVPGAEAWPTLRLMVRAGDLIHVPDGPMEVLGLLRRLKMPELRALAAEVGCPIDGLPQAEIVDKLYAFSRKAKTPRPVDAAPLDRAWRYDATSPREYLAKLFVEGEDKKLSAHGTEFGVDPRKFETAHDFMDELLVRAGYEKAHAPDLALRSRLDGGRANAARRRAHEEAERAKAKLAAQAPTPPPEAVPHEPPAIGVGVEVQVSDED